LARWRCSRAPPRTALLHRHCGTARSRSRDRRARRLLSLRHRRSRGGRRRAEAERAEQLVADETDRFLSWRASLDVVPAIASLRARAEAIRSAELAKVEGRVSPDERRTLESVTAQILNKLLHLPTVRMKEAAISADGAVYADAVRHLFGLEDDS